MSSLTIRAPYDDEAAAIAEFFNEISRHAAGRGETDEDEIRAWFTSPEVDRERDIRIALAADGSLAAYGDVAEDGGKVWLDLRQRFGTEDGSAGRAVFDALLPRARELVPAPVTLRAVVSPGGDSVRTMLEEDRFRLIRHSYRMTAELDADPVVPDWPPGITVRTFDQVDERAVYDVQNEGFADTWEYAVHSFEEWQHFLTKAVDFDPTLWFLALEGEEIAGICLCRPSRPGDASSGWIRVLCVRPRWRRQGIARALLLHAFREFRRRGLPRVGLGVDAESPTGAIELYERAGMTVAQRSDIYEKVL